MLLQNDVSLFVANSKYVIKKRHRNHTCDEKSAIPSLKDEEQGVSIVALILSIGIVRVHRNLCTNLIDTEQSEVTEAENPLIKS